MIKKIPSTVCNHYILIEGEVFFIFKSSSRHLVQKIYNRNFFFLKNELYEKNQCKYRVLDLIGGNGAVVHNIKVMYSQSQREVANILTLTSICHRNVSIDVRTHIFLTISSLIGHIDALGVSTLFYHFFPHFF